MTSSSLDPSLLLPIAWEVLASTADETFYIQREGLEGKEGIAPQPAFLLFSVPGQSKYRWRLWMADLHIWTFQTKKEAYDQLQKIAGVAEMPVRILRKTRTGYELVAASTRTGGVN